MKGNRCAPGPAPSTGESPQLSLGCRESHSTRLGLKRRGPDGIPVLQAPSRRAGPLVSTPGAGAHLGQPTSGQGGGGAPFTAHPFAQPSVFTPSTWADPFPKACRGWSGWENQSESSKFLSKSWKHSLSTLLPLFRILEQGWVGLE